MSAKTQLPDYEAEMTAQIREALQRADDGCDPSRAETTGLADHRHLSRNPRRAVAGRWACAVVCQVRIS